MPVFQPKIPEAYRDSEFLFLANIDPVLQRRVREQMPDVKLVAGDTMNYWIKDHKPALLEVLKGLDILLINDTETRMLAGKDNLVLAARAVLSMGPRSLVVKHGEYGATLLRARDPHRASAASALSALRRCRSMRWWIPPARGTALLAASSAILHRSARAHAGRFSPCHVLWRRDGLVRRGALRHRAAAGLSRKEIDERFNLFRELTHLD